MFSLKRSCSIVSGFFSILEEFIDCLRFESIEVFWIVLGKIQSMSSFMFLSLWLNSLEALESSKFKDTRILGTGSFCLRYDFFMSEADS